MNREFVSLLESLANGVLIADARGKVVFSNNFLDKMFGYEPGELLGKGIEALLPEDLVGAHARHRERYQQAPETRLMGAGRDLMARRKDGSVFPVEIGLSPLRISEEVQVAAIVTDITARKHAEQRSVLQRDVALTLSAADSLQDVAERLLSTLAETLGWEVAILWMTENNSGQLQVAATFANKPPLKAYAEASHRVVIRKGECLPGRVWSTLTPEWVPELAALRGYTRANDAFEAGLRSAFALPILVSGQALGVVEFYSRRERPDDPATTEIAGAVASQIGQFVERKRSQQALGVVEARYRTLFENAVFGIFRSTAGGEIQDANPAMAAILDWPNASEVLQLNLVSDIFKDPRDFERLVQDAAAAPRFDDREVEWKTRGGTSIEVQLSGRVVRGGDGKPNSIEAIVDNVSQRRLLERQFLQAQKMEAIGRLAGGVAHDFNNLLTIVAVSTDALLDQTSGHTAAREIISEIARATDQGASLVRQLMAFSRSQHPSVQAVNINDVIRTSQRMIGILAGEDVRIDLKLWTAHCPVAIEPNRFEQILMNLVANARDAMPGGGSITLATGLHRVDEELAHLYNIKPGHYVKLRVADNGHGMPPEIQMHIFEPFFSTKEEGKGTGLGLSTVYGIVRQHGGHIVCESVVGEGTTFTILLPAERHTEAETEQPHETPPPAQGAGRVLLVEDQPTLRVSIKRILERSGYDVVVAEDGLDAIRASEASAGTFDLLITDIVLPQMRGTELAVVLRQRYPRLRVLLMSGYSDEKISLNGASFLPKPFRRDALLQKIREVLEGNS